MVCYLRLDASSLTVLRNFLEIAVFHSGKVVLPVVDVNAVVVGGVAVDIVEIVDVKVDTADSEDVVAEVDIANREVVVDVVLVILKWMGHDAYCKVGESFRRLGRMLFESRWVICGDREVDGNSMVTVRWIGSLR